MLNQNENLDNILFDLYDIKAALTDDAKNTPKDSCTDFTIGDCLDDAILYLENMGA